MNLNIYLIKLTCVGDTSDLSMPPEVALENRANATFMAIAIRLDVLNGSSSYKMIKK